MTDKKRLVWFNGDLIPEKDAKISIYDSALMFGDMIFEMTRSFNGEQFKLREHLERLIGGDRRGEVALITGSRPVVHIISSIGSVRTSMVASGCGLAHVHARWPAKFIGPPGKFAQCFRRRRSRHRGAERSQRKTLRKFHNLFTRDDSAPPPAGKVWSSRPCLCRLSQYRGVRRSGMDSACDCWETSCWGMSNGYFQIADPDQLRSFD